MPIEFPEHNEEQNIWIAASDGNMALVQALLATGKFTPNSPDENGYTPMYVSPIVFVECHRRTIVDKDDRLTDAPS
jgi:P pilus assembly chaperone PapD